MHRDRPWGSDIAPGKRAKYSLYPAEAVGPEKVSLEPPVAKLHVDKSLREVRTSSSQSSASCAKQTVSAEFQVNW